MCLARIGSLCLAKGPVGRRDARVLIHEANWIGRTLLALSESDNGIALLNVGSSTAGFRTVDQPYIDARIFAPLRLDSRNRVIHCDLKADPGVDVTADITDERCLPGLRSYECDTFLVSNLLEHVQDLRLTVGNLQRLVAPGQNLLVTGPLRFPYHADPIDTMFRPSRSEVTSLFSGFTVREWFVASHFNIVTATQTTALSRVRGTLGLLRRQSSIPGSEAATPSPLAGVSAWCALLNRI
jgi:hypothetical protein